MHQSIPYPPEQPPGISILWEKMWQMPHGGDEKAVYIPRGISRKRRKFFESKVIQN